MAVVVTVGKREEGTAVVVGWVAAGWEVVAVGMVALEVMVAAGLVAAGWAFRARLVLRGSPAGRPACP
jgi:hypothetical protein